MTRMTAADRYDLWWLIAMVVGGCVVAVCVTLAIIFDPSHRDDLARLCIENGGSWVPVDGQFGCRAGDQ